LKQAALSSSWEVGSRHIRFRVLPRRKASFPERLDKYKPTQPKPRAAWPSNQGGEPSRSQALHRGARLPTGFRHIRSWVLRRGSRADPKRPDKYSPIRVAVSVAVPLLSRGPHAHEARRRSGFRHIRSRVLQHRPDAVPEKPDKFPPIQARRHASDHNLIGRHMRCFGSSGVVGLFTCELSRCQLVERHGMAGHRW
jgi:hypothetical protein